MVDYEPMVGRYFTVPHDGADYRVYVEEAGQGMPLLCLHTAGTDTRQYRHLLNDAEVTRRFGEDLSTRRRVFLVLAHEHTKDPDHYVGVLREVLLGLWARGESWEFQVVGPVLFHFSWGVRVAVFSRS